MPSVIEYDFITSSTPLDPLFWSQSLIYSPNNSSPFAASLQVVNGRCIATNTVNDCGQVYAAQQLPNDQASGFLIGGIETGGSLLAFVRANDNGLYLMEVVGPLIMGIRVTVNLYRQDGQNQVLLKSWNGQVQPGDIATLSIQGSLLTVTLNRITIMTATDTTYQTGEAGIGINANTDVFQTWIVSWFGQQFPVKIDVVPSMSRDTMYALIASWLYAQSRDVANILPAMPKDSNGYRQFTFEGNSYSIVQRATNDIFVYPGVNVFWGDDTAIPRKDQPQIWVLPMMIHVMVPYGDEKQAGQKLAIRMSEAVRNALENLSGRFQVYDWTQSPPAPMGGFVSWVRNPRGVWVESGNPSTDVCTNRWWSRQIRYTD